MRRAVCCCIAVGVDAGCEEDEDNEEGDERVGEKVGGWGGAGLHLVRLVFAVSSLLAASTNSGYRRD